MVTIKYSDSIGGKTGITIKENVGWVRSQIKKHTKLKIIDDTPGEITIVNYEGVLRSKHLNDLIDSLILNSSSVEVVTYDLVVAYMVSSKCKLYRKNSICILDLYGTARITSLDDFIKKMESILSLQLRELEEVVLHQPENGLTLNIKMYATPVEESKISVCEYENVILRILKEHKVDYVLKNDCLLISNIESKVPQKAMDYILFRIIHSSKNITVRTNNFYLINIIDSYGKESMNIDYKIEYDDEVVASSIVFLDDEYRAIAKLSDSAWRFKIK